MASHDEILDSKAAVPDGVVQRSFEAETLMLNLGSGVYHGVNLTGARLLELLAENDGDIRLSVERLARECRVPADEIAGDIAEFCAELADRGLLELDAR